MPDRGNLITLLPPHVSKDTELAVAYIRQEVLAARWVGLAWVGILPGRHYECDCAGEARRCPAFTQGTVLKLLNEIGKLPDLRR